MDDILRAARRAQSGIAESKPRDVTIPSVWLSEVERDCCLRSGYFHMDGSEIGVTHGVDGVVYWWRK